MKSNKIERIKNTLGFVGQTSLIIVGLIFLLALIVIPVFGPMLISKGLDDHLETEQAFGLFITHTALQFLVIYAYFH